MGEKIIPHLLIDNKSPPALMLTRKRKAVFHCKTIPSWNLSKFHDGSLMNFYCLETEENSACQKQAKMSRTVCLMTEISTILIMVLSALRRWTIIKTFGSGAWHIKPRCVKLGAAISLGSDDRMSGFCTCLIKITSFSLFSIILQRYQLIKMIKNCNTSKDG